MLNDSQSKRISELEDEVKSLRQQLKTAQDIIQAQNKKLQPLKTVKHETASEAVSEAEELLSEQPTAFNRTKQELTLQEITCQLHDFVCENTSKRLDKLVKSEMLLRVDASKRSMDELEDDINAIVQTVGWTKGVLISNWRKCLLKTETSDRFAIMLPAFFRVLSAWRTAKLNLTHEKITQLQELKYDHHAYWLLFNKIMPKLVQSKKLNSVHTREQTAIQNDRVHNTASLLVQENHSTNVIKEGRGKSHSTQSVNKKLARNTLKEDENAMEKKREKFIKRKLEKNRSIKIANEMYKKEQNKLRQVNWLSLYRFLKPQLEKHGPSLLRNYRKSYKVNEYDAVEKDERGPEISRFFSSIGLYDFDGLDPYCARKASDLTKRWCEIQTRKSKQTDATPENGHDFEHWVAAQLGQAGWKVTVTQASGDDGVDVIAEREGLSVAVQCKRYKGSVGNKAVQEVYSGMKHMELDRAVVISTGKYTKAAQNLATTTGVLLLSEHDISHLWKILNVK